MKKQQLKLIAAIANAMPVIIDNKAEYYKIKGHERNRKGELTGRKNFEIIIGIPVNHRRRLKKAFIRGGVPAMEIYQKRVEKHQSETKVA